MSGLSPIKKVIGETKVWPDRKMIKVERVSSEGNTYEALISPPELKLVKILKRLEGVLKPEEIAEIRETIEEYGQYEYSYGFDEGERLVDGD